MSCTVKILAPVLGYTDASGNLVSLVISGTASNCDLVLITIDCDGPRQNATAKVSDGVWSTTIPLIPRESQCDCDKSINIHVQCISGECRDDFSGSLQCLPQSQCPNAYSDVDLIDSTEKCVGGKRMVTGKVVVAPTSAKPVGTTVKIDGTVVGTHGISATPYPVPFTATLSAGSHMLTWEFSDPSCSGAGQTIKVPACEGCPNIEVETTEGPCRDGKRTVTVMATIPDQGVAVAAAIIHGGKKIAQDSQTGAYTLTGSDDFPGGTNTVTVEISQPAGCQPTSTTFNVTPCDDRPPSGSTPPGPGSNGGDDDGDGSGGCIIGRIAVVLLFAAAIFLTLLALCLPPPATAIAVAAAVAWVVAGVAMAIWAAFCGSRCGTYLITWQSSLFGAWLAAYMVTCCPLAVVALIALGASASAFFALWVQSCKPSLCRVFLELLWVTAVPVATVLAGLSVLLPCGLLSGVAALNAVVTASLTISAAAACAAK
jgi:hypothetical protein